MTPRTHRRVVTGTDVEGRSVIASDDVLDGIAFDATPDYRRFPIWASDLAAVLPSDGSPPPHDGYFPPPGGFRFVLGTIPAERSTASAGESSSVAAEAAEKFPGMLDAYESTDLTRHTTQTVDFMVVLEGEITLELDDGVDTVLRQGDVLVQNGTAHAWHNRSDSVCKLAFVLIGAELAAREPTIVSP